MLGYHHALSFAHIRYLRCSRDGFVEFVASNYVCWSVSIFRRSRFLGIRVEQIASSTRACLTALPHRGGTLAYLQGKL